MNLYAVLVMFCALALLAVAYYGWILLNGLGVYVPAGDDAAAVIAWAKETGKEAYSGSAVAAVFWPITVAAATAAVAAGWALAMAFGSWGLSLHTKAELAKLATRLEHANGRANTADQRAREALAAEWQRLRETQAAVELRRADAEQMVANARQIASAATERAAIAERDMARLEKRSKNHKEAFTRLRAKVDRMEAEQDGS